MSKNKNKKVTMRLPQLSGTNILKKISAMVNPKKHFKINGSKEEKKLIQSICLHHIIDKHGRLRNTTRPSGKNKERCECMICHDQYKAGYYTTEQVAQAYAMCKEIASQMKLLAVVCHCDQETINAIVQFNIMLDNMPKTYMKLKKVACKAGQKKEEKKGPSKESISRTIWKYN